MRELLRSNDWVHLSWARSILAAAGIDSLVLDEHVSGVEGSIGAIPRRLVVDAAVHERARRLLDEAERGLARD